MKTLNECSMIFNFKRNKKAYLKWVNINNRKMRRFKRMFLLTESANKHLFGDFPKNEFRPIYTPHHPHS